MKTYDEVVAGVLEGTAAHHRKVKRMQKIASLTAMCAVCIVGLSVYMNLEPQQSLPADSGSDIITETQPYLEHQPSEYEDSSVQNGTAPPQEKLPTEALQTESESVPQTEASVLPPPDLPATEQEGIQNVIDPVSTEPLPTDPAETQQPVQEETQEAQTAPTPTEPPVTNPVDTQPPIVQTDPPEPTVSTITPNDEEPTFTDNEDTAYPPPDGANPGDFPADDVEPTETTETTTTAPIYQTTTVTVTATVSSEETSTEKHSDVPVSWKFDLPYCRLFHED